MSRVPYHVQSESAREHNSQGIFFGAEETMLAASTEEAIRRFRKKWETLAPPVARRVGFRQLPGESRWVYLHRCIKWVRMAYRKQREHETCHPSFSACEVLREAEKNFPDLGTFGTEGVPELELSYLNTGDGYEHTLVFYSNRERFTVDSWADIVERRGFNG